MNNFICSIGILPYNNIFAEATIQFKFLHAYIFIPLTTAKSFTVQL